jgi:N-acylneuraminate cytidylyltransferase/CMP-N,N'-diacetyllegionaminic acid synthase
VERPSTLALVPARGGSKSIPLKNIKPLAGRPLIEYALAAIAASGVVDRTCVSTDDDRIADAARAAGAEVPFMRPSELARDDTPSPDVVHHALRWLEHHEDSRPEYVLLVQPTEPFVRPEQIRAALELLLARDADSAITVVEVPRNDHPYHVRVMDEDGWLEFADPDAHYAHPTRQDDPPRWAFANLYWFKRDLFLRTRRLEVGRRVGLAVDALSALDINTPDDWRIAEAVLASTAAA